METKVCQECLQDCEIKVAKTEKNMGREFWVCTNSRCVNTWNGWVDGGKKRQKTITKENFLNTVTKTIQK